jgi:very-short-patch-repair endonuclease
MRREALTPVAQDLRNHPTEAERHLWRIVRAGNMGVKFRRQAVIGRYVVDFVCFEKKLVIEVDGGQHDQDQKDVRRDEWLKSQGYQVLRFWNNDVLGNMDGVYGVIEARLNSPTPAPPHAKCAGEGVLGS